MNPPLRILVALDGSPGAESILPALMPLARIAPVDLVLYEVVEEPGKAEEARAYLERMRAALALHRIPARARVDVGSPAPMILDALEGGGFNLAAMSTHGRRGLDRIVMGSVAETVVRASGTPVLINRPDARIGDWKKIVVALDGSDAAEAVLDDVTDFARRTDSTLHLFTVAEVLVTTAGLDYGYSAAALPDMKPYLAGVAKRLTDQGLKVAWETRFGTPGPDIVRYATEVKAGLIALTTHGRTGIRRVLMGSVAEQVFRTSPCAVYVKPLGNRAKADQQSPSEEVPA